MKTSLTLAAILVATLTGCATSGVVTTNPPGPDFIDSSRWPEKRALPSEAGETPLPEGIPPEMWIDKMACIDKGGLCISPAMGARLAIYKTAYDSLRGTFEADRQVWRTHRAAYEAQIDIDRNVIKDLQPTWWNNYGGVVWGVGGFTIGLGSAITIIYLLK